MAASAGSLLLRGPQGSSVILDALPGSQLNVSASGLVVAGTDMVQTIKDLQQQLVNVTAQAAYLESLVSNIANSAFPLPAYSRLRVNISETIRTIADSSGIITLSDVAFFTGAHRFPRVPLHSGAAGTVWANSFGTTHGGAGPGWYAFDNDVGTHWESADVGRTGQALNQNASLSISLALPLAYLSAVRFACPYDGDTRTDCPRRWTVEGSRDNGQTWDPLCTQNGITMGDYRVVAGLPSGDRVTVAQTFVCKAYSL